MSKNKLPLLKLSRSLKNVSLTVKKDWGLYKDFISCRLNKVKDIEEEKKEEIREKVEALDAIWGGFCQSFNFLNNRDIEQSSKLQKLKDIDFQMPRKSLAEFEEGLKELKSLVSKYIPSPLLNWIGGCIKAAIFEIYNMFIAGSIITEHHFFTDSKAAIPMKKTSAMCYSDLIQAAGFLSDRLPQDRLEERFGDSSKYNILVKS